MTRLINSVFALAVIVAAFVLFICSVVRAATELHVSQAGPSEFVCSVSSPEDTATLNFGLSLGRIEACTVLNNPTKLVEWCKTIVVYGLNANVLAAGDVLRVRFKAYNSQPVTLVDVQLATKDATEQQFLVVYDSQILGNVYTEFLRNAGSTGKTYSRKHT